jgi:hypothetical protein
MKRVIFLILFILTFTAINAFAVETQPFSIALLDTTAGFTVLKDLNDDGFFNSTRAGIRYLTGTGAADNGAGGIMLTSALSSSGGREYANFSLLGNNTLNQHYRINWQLERDSGITEDAMARVLDLAIQSRGRDINSVVLDSVASMPEARGFTVAYSASDGGDAIPGYSVSMNFGPSQTHYFWRTFTELMVLNSFGLFNYFFIQRDDNMVDWEYQPTPDGFKKKMTDGWSLDTNNFRTNSLYHIYAGIIYYQTARSNNYDPFASFVWCFMGSLFWEYIGEYREQVSTNDQIFTPMGGVIFGEGLRQLSLWAERSMRPGVGRGVVCFILDPLRIVNRQLDRWASDSFVVTVSFVNPAQTMITERVMERVR